MKAILEALSCLEQSCYPTNVMIEIAEKKVIRALKNIETAGKILKATVN